MDPDQQLEIANSIFREANDAFFIFNPEGHSVLDVNPAAQRLSGYRRKELLGLSLADLLISDRENSLESLIRAYEETSIFHARDGYSLVRRDGQRVPINVSASRIHTSSAPLGLVVVRDVSERKQAEEERRKLEAQVHQDQRLESLGIMAGGVAHDFNNLLTGILGYSELALSKLDESSPLQKNLSMIRASAKRAADLTRQMLAFAGRGSFDKEPVDVTLLVTELSELMRASVSKKIAFRFDTLDALPCVEADATQLSQVLMNLIANASDAIGDETGTITVKTDALDIDPADFTGTTWGSPLEAREYVRIEVSDTGVGMDEETASKVFEPFFTTKFAGRGLGMASVLGIVKGHDGVILCSTRLAEGTSFTVLLPALDLEAELLGADEPVAHPQPDSGLILVIEDEEPVRDVVRTTLEGVGYCVIVARDGREGVRVFEERGESLDAILLDMTMPFLDGEEVLRQIRAKDADLPVVLCSGFTLREDEDGWLDRNANGFIQKPFGPNELLETLRAAIART